MKPAIALTTSLLCTLLISFQTNAQSSPNQPTLDWNPTLEAFTKRVQPHQSFPQNQVSAASQSTLDYPLDYPLTIRVRHHAQNSCRDLPTGQIDTIPFEEYVARVLPSEVPPSWEPAALQAQAIAIRTYAWRQILANRPDYDLTDWVDFQHMCDYRYPSADAAATATVGQYLSAISDPNHRPISAMYSAENGHPTLTNNNVDYLKSVPDLPALGRERHGHGYGLSQWGAQRRALAGHSYSDILGHYYTNIHLTNAQRPEEIAAHLIGIQDGDLLRANGLHWRTLLSTSHAVAPTIILARKEQSRLITFTHAVGDWQPIQPLRHQEIITISLQISNTIYDQHRVQFDTQPPPAPSITAATIISSTALPITITTPATTSIALAQPWRWQGQSFTRVGNSWHSPPTATLPADQSYRALINLRSTTQLSATLTHSPLARLTVSDLDFDAPNGQTILGLRHLWQSDLISQTGVIAIDFHLFKPAHALSIQLTPNAPAEFIIDHTQILRLPVDLPAGQSRIDLPLHAVNGQSAIFAAAFDPAGNISQLISQTIQVNDITPPIIGPIQPQPAWHRTLPITLNIPITDTLSGLDLQSGSLLITNGDTSSVFGSQSLAVTFAQPENPWTAQRATTIIPALEDGHYTMRFAAADAAGNPQQSPSIPLRIDTTNPEISIALSPSSTNPDSTIERHAEWQTQPISLTLTATDTTSGIDTTNLDSIVYTISGAPTQPYTAPITINAPGRHRIQAWSTDVAGNPSLPIETEIGLDLAAPTIQYSTQFPGPSIIVVTWQATDDASGVARIQLQQRQDDSWIPVTLSTAEQTAAAATIQTNKRNTLKIRMRATDNANQRSAWLSKTITLPNEWHYFPLMMTDN